MPEFAYEALAPDGAVKRGAMSADNETDLENRLRQDGHFLISAEPQASQPAGAEGEASEAGAGPAAELTDGRIPPKDLLAFTEYLWGATQAGIPILTTLEDLEYQAGNKRLRQIVTEVRYAMSQEGKSLSEALGEHPRAFPQLYVGTIEAGEATGQLDYTLEQLVRYLEWQREINLQIRQATLYPIIVLAIMAGLIVLLVTLIYPRLMPVFTGFGIELPLPTRVLMGLGDFFSAYWLFLVAGLAAVALGYMMVVRTPRGRLAADTMKLRLPIFGRLIREIEMARVVTYMSLFYRTGIDLLRGLILLEQMLPNRRVALGVHEARMAISEGASITQAFAATEMFPQVVLRGMALGESTGKLDETLERARTYYAREVPAAVRRMLAALQPLLIVVLGGLIAFIALSIFLPIVGVYQSISR